MAVKEWTMVRVTRGTMARLNKMISRYNYAWQCGKGPTWAGSSKVTADRLIARMLDVADLEAARAQRRSSRRRPVAAAPDPDERPDNEVFSVVSEELQDKVDSISANVTADDRTE